MRRTKTVLAVVAVMAAMLVAFAAPAMANNTNDNNVQRSSSNIFGDHDHNDGFNHRDNDDDHIIFVSDDSDFDDFDFDDDWDADDWDDDDWDDDDSLAYFWGYPYFWG
jgi:hypothetical protein